MEVLSYVGPPEIRARPPAPRFLLSRRADCEEILRAITGGAPRPPLAATFVISTAGELWIADRRSEHVSCARGEAVLSAGEILFDRDRGVWFVAEITNQSTGYCPPVESWEAVHLALRQAGLEHPDVWTHAFAFRRCESCQAIALIKDEDFTCSVCGARLSATWNFR